MKKALVILGPTSTGKTDLALELAKKFNGELLACDSRQVYVGLDIGTGKMPDKFKIENLKLKIEHNKGYWVVDGLRIWMYDVVSLKKQYTVADYVKDAEGILGDILNRGKLPIIVGGTGLYLKALLEGLSNLAIPVDKKLRRELNKLTLRQLQEKLRMLSSARWETLNNSDRQNPRRLMRAIELDISPRRSPYGHLRGVARFNVLKFGLTAPREILYKNVDFRILKWLDLGIIQEVEKLMHSGITSKRFKQLGLEYGLIVEYIQSRKYESIDNLVTKIKGKLHNYIRRQLTWFKKEKDVFWFDITEKDFPSNIENLVAKWYYDSNT